MCTRRHRVLGESDTDRAGTNFDGPPVVPAVWALAPPAAMIGCNEASDLGFADIGNAHSFGTCNGRSCQLAVSTLASRRGQRNLPIVGATASAGFVGGRYADLTRHRPWPSPLWLCGTRSSPAGTLPAFASVRAIVTIAVFCHASGRGKDELKIPESGPF